MSTDDEVRKASRQFYAALTRMSNGDASLMADIWSQGEAVTTMHPIGGREIGWEAVKGSFEQVAQLAADGKIELRDQFIQVAGDIAYEAGIEHGQVNLAGHPVAIDWRVTNIYRRQAGAWKLVHHHADISPSMLDVLSRLQPPPGGAGG